MLKRTIGFAAMACMTAAACAQRAAIEQVRPRTQPASAGGATDLRMIAEERGEVVELTGQPARLLRFRTSASTSIEHQSNAALLPSGIADDWLSLSSFDAGFNRPLGEKFSLDLSVRADVARYFRIENISYWGPSATALLDYRHEAGWPRVYAGGQLYRYDLIDTGAKITDAGAVIAGLDHSWIFQEGRSGLSAGYQFSRFWAFPRTEDRESHAIFATFTHQFTATLYAQASYIWQYSDFLEGARSDSRHTIGFGAIYAPREFLTARVYMNFVRNESSNPLTDYENFTAGVGATISLQF